MNIYIYIYNNQIIHHNPCFNLFILHNNSFHKYGNEKIKMTFFYVSTYCPLRKLSSYYTFNKFTSSYHSTCLRLCSQLTWDALIYIYMCVCVCVCVCVLNSWAWMEIHNIVSDVYTLRIIMTWIDIRDELRNPESTYHITLCDNKWQVKLPNIFSKDPISDTGRGPKVNTEDITKIYQ